MSQADSKSAVALFPSFLLLAVFFGTASIAVALFPNFLLLAAMESWVGAEDEAKMQSFRFRKVLPCFACNPMQEHNTTSSQRLLCYMSPNNVSDTVLMT